MKPAWEKLADAFEGDDNVVIVDVDCTNKNSEKLCQKYGVRGYPTLKYFSDATDPLGDKYEGGRDFAALKEFADENLGPACSPANLDLCDADEVALIETYQEMSQEELQALVNDSEQAIEDAEADFKAEVEKLQKKYEQLSKEKDEAVENARSPELRVVRQVLRQLNAPSGPKDEL